MIGFNGGLIGGLANARTTSTLKSNPGMWTLAEQRKAIFNVPSTWPSIDGDQYYANVSILLHGDGADNSTTFTDNSPRTKTATRIGDTKISTTRSKFGGSSIAFDGSGDNLSYAAVDDFSFGSGDFTLEFWAWFNTNSGGQSLTRQHAGGDQFQFSFYMPGTGNLAYYLSSTGNTWNVASGATFGTITANTWIHVALVRNGNTFTPYLNGVAGTTTTSSATLFASTSALLLGGGPGIDFFNGFIDDYRITKGVARYTANFSGNLPLVPFPDF